MNIENNNRKTFAALAMFPAAYIYTLLTESAWTLWLGIFVLMYVLIVEYMNSGKKRSAESFIFLGCMGIITLCLCFEHGRVWEAWQSALFVHGLAVWWTLNRSGALLENESGHLIVFDAVNAIFRFAFGGFFQRSRCIRQSLQDARKTEGEGKKSALLWAIPAVLIGAMLLYWVTDSLAAADEGFGSLTKKLLELFSFGESEKLKEFFIRLIVSLPIGAWLFGLIERSSEARREELDARALGIKGAIAKMRVVPDAVWIVCMGAFSLVYLMFFVIQGRYLFGAFTRTLPEGFIVSQYARQGFFELCRVMGINFVLLWLVTRSSIEAKGRSRTVKVMCSMLLAAGILFAVIAISKLGLYISCFGFTPKRLQSTWLATVLMCGSGTAMYSLWSGKKSFKNWLIFAVVTLTLLQIY